MTTITKQIDANGNVYSVEDRGDGTIIQIKADPILTYAPTPASIAVNEVLTLEFQLKDFDGEIRHDNRPITFLIDGVEIIEELVEGFVSIDIQSEARGLVTIALAPVELQMMPVTVQVV